MGAAAVSVYDQIEVYLDTSPAFTGGFSNVMSDIVRQAVSAPARRRAIETKEEIEAFMRNLDRAKEDLKRLVKLSKDEHNAIVNANAILMMRVTTLEADLEEWRREYEPDADARRPPFFSNVRQALHVLFHTR